MNSQKIKTKILSKSKKSLNGNINKSKEKNKSIKSSKKRSINKTTSSDTKPKNINRISNSFKSKIKNEEEKNWKRSQEINNSKILVTDINYSTNIINEKKVKNSIQRLIDTSKNLLKEQNNILLENEKLIQNITVNDHEINKMEKKDNSLNFRSVINNYTENLDIILSKIKKNTKDIEFTNQIKEENNNLKYKIQMLSMDKNDDFRNVETELNSIKKIYSTEINGMLNFLNELGFQNLPFEQISSPNNLTSEKIKNFFKFLKQTIKQLKDSSTEKEEQIQMIKKYNDKNENIKNQQKIFSNTEYLNKINNENENYNVQKSFNILNNTKDILSQDLNTNFLSNNINNYNKSINNDRIKKIEDLCLQNNYEDDNNQSSEIYNKKTYEIDNNFLSEDDNKKSQSYMDNFQRTKNMVNKENSNSGLGIQLEHNYTDSYFYQNMKDSYSNINNKNIDNINLNEKDYLSQINQNVNQ